MLNLRHTAIISLDGVIAELDKNVTEINIVNVVFRDAAMYNQLIDYILDSNVTHLTIQDISIMNDMKIDYTISNGIIRILNNKKLIKLCYDNIYNLYNAEILELVCSSKVKSLVLNAYITHYEYNIIRKNKSLIHLKCLNTNSNPDLCHKLEIIAHNNNIRQKCIIILGCKTNIPNTRDINCYKDLLRMIAICVWNS